MTTQELPREHFVKAWMNPPDHRVAPTAFAEDAFSLMKREHIRHLLVTEGDELVGVVTDRDLRRPDRHGGDVMSVTDLYRLGDELRVEDVMTTEVVTVAPDDLTAFAARLMVENKINCLPVVRDGEVIGILTSDDLLAALVYALDPEFLEAREADRG